MLRSQGCPTSEISWVLFIFVIGQKVWTPLCTTATGYCQENVCFQKNMLEWASECVANSPAHERGLPYPTWREEKWTTAFCFITGWFLWILSFGFGLGPDTFILWFCTTFNFVFVFIINISNSIHNIDIHIIITNNANLVYNTCSLQLIQTKLGSSLLLSLP